MMRIMAKGGGMMMEIWLIVGEEDGQEVCGSSSCRVAMRVENPCNVEDFAVGLVWAPQWLKVQKLG